MVGVELQDDVRGALVTQGFEVVAATADLSPGTRPELVTMFHVLEHLTKPMEVLEELRRVMAPGGTLIGGPARARRTHRTVSMRRVHGLHPLERAVLHHTRGSLRRMIEHAGFHLSEMMGIQRYPLADHLHWLGVGRPGGHVEWNDPSGPALEAEYEALLDRLDLTDTLWAVAEVPLD